MSKNTRPKKRTSVQLIGRSLFFDEPNREFHVRQVAKLTGKSPSTVSKHLQLKVKEGLLLSRKEKGFCLYKANSENPIFKEEKRHFNILKIMRSGILEYLEKELNYPAIILFGSYAKAENSVNSDIDFFVLSETKKKLELDAFEKQLGAPIQLFMHSRKQFEQMKKNNKELVNNILNGVKLSGFLEVFR